jgi:hypothetical protein
MKIFLKASLSQHNNKEKAEPWAMKKHQSWLLP